MNLCLLGTIATGVETLRARVEYNMERGASKFCSDWTLADTGNNGFVWLGNCLLYTSPSPRDLSTSRMPSSA